MVFSAFNLYTTYASTRNTIDLTIGYQAISVAQNAIESFDLSTYEDSLTNHSVHKDIIETQLNEIKQYLGAKNVYIIEPDAGEQLTIKAASTLNSEKKQTEVCCELSKELEKQFAKKRSFFIRTKDNSNKSLITSVIPLLGNDGMYMGSLVVESKLGTGEEITQEVMRRNIPFFIINGLFVLFSLTIFIAFQIWYRKEVSTQVGDAEETYQSEFESMLQTMRAIRHDFLNHIQVIQGLMKIGREDRAFEYVNSLTSEVETMELPVTIKNPALYILVQSKWVRAQNEKVDMHLYVDDHLFKHIHTIDLIKIFSNLIDNAFDATLIGSESERFINIEARVIQNQYIFKVENIGPTIPKDHLNKIFETGFSTKPEKRGVPRGDGLSIVKQVVHKYGGTINVQSNKNSTTFEVKIPFKS